MGQVEGKIALVTGGASGIGEACVETLAREGAAVVISDIDDVRGNDLAAEINAAGRQAIYLRHDVTDEARWQEIVAEISSTIAGPAISLPARSASRCQTGASCHPPSLGASASK